MPADQRDLDYGAFFRQRSAAADYLRRYEPGSGSSDRWVWEFQRRRLRAILQAFRAERPAARALDYACGGGRVLGPLAEEFGQVQGWDSSPAMLEHCARNVPGVPLRCVDLAEVDPAAAILTERFDVITAFRLFLNLAPERRRPLLHRLAGLLNPGGLLIFDNHGNRHSLRHLTVSLAGHRHRFANEWSDREVRAELTDARLAVVGRTGFGWLPEVVHRNRLSRSVARRAEEFLLTHTGSARLAIRVLYLARPVGGGPEGSG